MLQDCCMDASLHILNQLEEIIFMRKNLASVVFFRTGLYTYKTLPEIYIHPPTEHKDLLYTVTNHSSMSIIRNFIY